MTEQITWDGKALAHIVRAGTDPDQTTFVTPSEYEFQVGFVVYPARGEIARHVHLPLERRITGTSEVLIVKKGRCEIDVYSEDEKLVATRELGAGDVVVLIRGGHGFRVLEDTVFLEVKQGPFTEVAEKRRF